MLDVLEPLVGEDRKKEQPALKQLPGYELVAGLNNNLDMTTDEGEVAATLHDLLVGGAWLEDASEITAQAYKEHDIHEHGTNLMVEHNPNPYEHTSPSRY